jgi:hypothetical protein
MPGQFVPSPKNRTPRRGGSRVSPTGREESGPLRGPLQIAARAEAEAKSWLGVRQYIYRAFKRWFSLVR